MRVLEAGPAQLPGPRTGCPLGEAVLEIPPASTQKGSGSRCLWAPSAHAQERRTCGATRVWGGVHSSTNSLQLGRPGLLGPAREDRGLCFSNGAALPSLRPPIPIQLTYKAPVLLGTPMFLSSCPMTEACWPPALSLSDAAPVDHPPAPSSRGPSSDTAALQSRLRTSSVELYIPQSESGQV